MGEVDDHRVALDHSAPTRPRDHGGRPLRAGLAASIVTAVAYLPGADRSLTYDAAETVGFFVLAPSPSAALTRQRSFNNHPFFSFLEHLIVSAAGHSQDWLLRLLPIGFGALTVGVLVGAVSRSAGPLPGFAAGVVVATNPMFIELSRDVRGYSLLVFAAVVATMLYLELARSITRPVVVAYVVIALVGVMTHFLMAGVLAAHMADVIARRRLRLSWVAIWTTIAGASVAFYLPMLDEFVDAGQTRGRIFRPGFPVDLARELLGREMPSVALIGVLSVGGIHVLGHRRSPVPTFLATSALVLLAGWFVAPENLAPRFFLWALPGIAMLVAFAVKRYPLAGGGALGAAALISVIGVIPGYTESRNRYHDLAELIDHSAGAGATVCVTNLSVPPMLAYTRDFEPRTRSSYLGSCDIVVVAEPALDHEYVVEAAKLFPYRSDLPARDPAIVFSRDPLSASPSTSGD